MMWRLVRILGSGCRRSTVELEACGAEMYRPVKKERRRVGHTRNKFIVVEEPAYPGWVFMRGRPDPELLAHRPWLRFKIMQGRAAVFSNEQIEAIMNDEHSWNMKIDSNEERVRFDVGDKVCAERGLMKGKLMTVIEDRGSWVAVKIEGEESFSSIKINPFLLDKIPF